MIKLSPILLLVLQIGLIINIEPNYQQQPPKYNQIQYISTTDPRQSRLQMALKRIHPTKTTHPPNTLTFYQKNIQDILDDDQHPDQVQQLLNITRDQQINKFQQFLTNEYIKLENKQTQYKKYQVRFKQIVQQNRNTSILKKLIDQVELSLDPAKIAYNISDPDQLQEYFDVIKARLKHPSGFYERSTNDQRMNNQYAVQFREIVDKSKNKTKIEGLAGSLEDMFDPTKQGYNSSDADSIQDNYLQFHPVVYPFMPKRVYFSQKKQDDNSSFKGIDQQSRNRLNKLIDFIELGFNPNRQNYNISDPKQFQDYLFVMKARLKHPYAFYEKSNSNQNNLDYQENQSNNSSKVKELIKYLDSLLDPSKQAYNISDPEQLQDYYDNVKAVIRHSNAFYEKPNSSQNSLDSQENQDDSSTDIDKRIEQVQQKIKNRLDPDNVAMQMHMVSNLQKNLERIQQNPSMMIRFNARKDSDPEDLQQINYEDYLRRKFKEQSIQEFGDDVQNIKHKLNDLQQSFNKIVDELEENKKYYNSKEFKEHSISYEEYLKSEFNGKHVQALGEDAQKIKNRMKDVQKTFDKAVDYFNKQEDSYYPESGDALVHGFVVESFKNEMKNYVDNLEEALVEKNAMKIQDQINEFNNVFSTDQEDEILQESMDYLNNYVDKQNRIDKKVMRGTINQLRKKKRQVSNLFGQNEDLNENKRKTSSKANTNDQKQTIDDSQHDDPDEYFLNSHLDSYW